MRAASMPARSALVMILAPVRSVQHKHNNANIFVHRFYARIFPSRTENAKVVSGAPSPPLGPATMSDKSASRAAQPLLPVELGAGKIRFAQGMKAGRWVFATGLMAQDFVNGIAPDVLATRAPHASLPKREKEAQRIFEN